MSSSGKTFRLKPFRKKPVAAKQDRKGMKMWETSQTLRLSVTENLSNSGAFRIILIFPRQHPSTYAPPQAY